VCQLQTKHERASLSERHCSSVSGGTLHSSLFNCLKAASVFRCQSSAGTTVLQTEFLWTSSLLCCRSDDVELTAETFACLHDCHLWMIT